VPVRESKDHSLIKVDVVGPVCETGDFFALDRDLPEVQSGDILALMSAGAYGFTMASNYNSRPFPAEILISGSEAKVVRRRQSYADLIDHEITEG
jgi:diaminopimelate decarboxylase